MSRALPLNSAALRKLRHTLLDWYDQNHRELPWRQSGDPYRVWVSEIMLQQTRVAAVLDHYARFLRRFPTVSALAAARESSVLAAWSGLGYYHRAQRMHQAAKVIMREHRGEFPRTAESWRELPGIGRYTAAAVASIAFGEAVALVDGNVERVLGRVFGRDAGSKNVWQRAEELLDRTRPGDFNQAMMELGATICTPRAPECALCPLNGWCKSRGAHDRRPQMPRKRKQLCYALARKGRAVLLVQRPETASLMAGMWELPEVQPSVVRAGKQQVPPARPVSRRNDNSKNRTRGEGAPLFSLRHSITVTDYTVRVWRQPALDDAAGKWIPVEKLSRVALTGLARKILRKAEIIPAHPASSAFV